MSATVTLYEEISAATPGRIAADLAKAKGPVELRINSSGGDVFHGIAIANQLKQRGNVTAYIDGIAASIASFIAVSAQKLTMLDGPYLMLHRPFAAAGARAEDFLRYADPLDKAEPDLVAGYMGKSKQSDEQVRAWLEAETWLTSSEAVATGLADNIQGGGRARITNQIDLSQFVAVPPALAALAAKRGPGADREARLARALATR